MVRISIESVCKVTMEALTASGVSRESAEIILDTILYANRSGIPTHGIGRLPLYLKKIKAGHLNPKDEVTCAIDADAVAVLDAHNGFGQVAGRHAVDLAITKAQQYGISFVGVRNGNNFGAAGYFGDYAARKGMAAFVFANAAPAIAPTGGKKTLLGTNPMCYAFPGSTANHPIVLDMATSVVARGKVRLAAKNGQKIPTDWAIGPDGLPTDDPNEALKGSLLPIAGYKGYGLSLFVDILAGLLTGSAYAGGVKQLSDMDADSNNGNMFILMDVKRFMSAEELDERVDSLYRTVRACGDPGQVLLPGEPGYLKMETQREYVEISETQFEEINKTVSAIGIADRLTVC